MYPFLLFIWFMLNGRFTWEITILGVLLCGLVHLFAKKHMDYSLKKDLNLLRRIGLFVIYLGVLIWEIVKANWKVMLLILAGHHHTDSTIIQVRIPLKTELARTILANSITMTPGTITISLDEDLYTVHALHPIAAEGMENSTFVTLLQKMEETL